MSDTPANAEPSIPAILRRIEQWGLARCPERELSRLEPAVEKLSQHFTTERPEQFTCYLDEPDALTAYALFFAPQTVVRTHAALTGILNRLPDFPKRPLRILDLGCGIGSGAMAARLLARERTGFEPSMTCVDWSAEALRVAQTFLPSATMVQADIRSFTPQGEYDLVLASFALNEIFTTSAEMQDALRRYLGALSADAPSFLLLLEPADRSTTPRLHALRTVFPECPVYAPCPHNCACPMVATRDGICHDVRTFKPGRPTILLNRRLHRTISDVKFSLLALGRRGGEPAKGMNDAEFLRLVGPVDKARGLLICRACMGDGKLRKVQIPTSALTPERKHALIRRERGDCAWLAGSLEYRKQLENGTIQRTADLLFTDETPPEVSDTLDDTFRFSL